MTLAMRVQERIALQAALLDEVDAAVIYADSEFVVRYWSRGAQRLYGYAPEEAVGRGLMDLMVPESSRAAAQELELAVRAGMPVDGEIDVQDKHGRVIPVYFRVRSVPDGYEVGPGRGTISVAVDISARREAEAAIRCYAEGQEEIANLGRLALEGGSLEELYDHAVDAASRVLSGDCAELVAWSPDVPEFVVAATIGWPDARRGAHIPADGHHSGLLHAVTSHEPFVVEDWEEEQHLARSSELLARGVRSTVAVHVDDAECPFGVLAVHYTRPRAVPADCLAFLESLANVLAESIRSRNAQEEIRHQALHDGLTGLPNRTLFLDRVAHSLAGSARHREPLAVFFVDLDQFKLVNDSLGHEAGDELLRLVAPRLAGALRAGDTLARLGGDEFAVLCDHLPSEDAATRIASHLIKALKQPVVLGDSQHTVSASIGIAFGTAESTPADLLRDADAAMYQAKKSGRDRFELFDKAMHNRIVTRVRTESALRAALAQSDDKEQIYVAYQPLVSMRSGQIVGAEALARWHHPDWGPVAPLEFIGVAEESGLIHQLGAYVMRRAGREGAAWRENPGFTGIAVNVSPRQLCQFDEVERVVREVIDADGIAPGFLTLEITESVLIEHLDQARDTLESLNDLGVRISLDDFGTGYSSLSYLADLPFDNVKVDRSLIKEIALRPEAEALAAAIIKMGHALKKQVIAEGVESREQAARLRALDCDLAQGYLFARPMAPEALTALLEDRPGRLAASTRESALAT